MKKQRTFTDDMMDIGIWALMVLALIFLAISNVPAARADESTGPFIPRALICGVSGPAAGQCQELAAQPEDTLAACFKRGEDFHARMKSGESVSEAVKTSRVPITLKWMTACLNPATGEMLVPVEGEATFGGEKT